MSDRFTHDDLARPVALGPGARRIVSIAPSCTECLLAIGAGNRLVGVEEHTELPEVAGLPRVGGFKHVDLDRIVALTPDLVVVASLHVRSTAAKLEAKGIPVFVTQPRTLDAVLNGMARLAAVVGIAAEAAPYLERGRARLRAVLDRTLRARRRPLVYVEFSKAGHTGGPQSFLDDLVTKAGGVNLGGLARVEWPVLPAGLVLRFDPDVIVIARSPSSATRESLRARPGWAGVAAVKAGRVWEVPVGIVKRPGPGLLDGLERLAEIFDEANQFAEAHR
jgi:iron complex transport system substrate-binding protein